MTPSWRRIVARIHLSLALGFCLPLVLMGLSGSLMVLQDTINSWQRATPIERGPAQSIATLLAAARQVAPPGLIPVSYAAPAISGDGLAVIRLAPPHRRGSHATMLLQLKLDPVTLRVVPPTVAERISATLLQFHSSLFAGPAGRKMVGCFGIVLLTLGLSGIVNWWPKGQGWRRAFGIAKGARGARFHRALGIWSAGVFLTVVTGGITLAFPETIRSAAVSVFLAHEMPIPHIAPIAGTTAMSVDDAVGLAQKTAPGTQLAQVFLPAQGDMPYRIVLSQPGRDRLAPALTLFVDPWTRRIIESCDPRRFGPGDRLLAWQHALHAGQGFGQVWRLLVFLTGFLPLTFAVTGLRLWWLTRQSSRRTARFSSIERIPS